MNLTCKDRERIFEDGTLAEWAALEIHATACAACAEELRSWKFLSGAAQELRDYSDNGSLWQRIQRSLIQEGAHEHSQQGLAETAHATLEITHSQWPSFWQSWMQSWRTLAATAAILFFAISAGWFYTHRSVPPRSADLLKRQALSDVERAESAYVQAIGKLSASAQPQLGNPETPLLASYKEKLQVLDSAIDDLHAQTNINPSNAHLRYELLAMYQEKQKTLEEILEEKR